MSRSTKIWKDSFVCHSQIFFLGLLKIFFKNKFKYVGVCCVNWRHESYCIYHVTIVRDWTIRWTSHDFNNFSLSYTFMHIALAEMHILIWYLFCCLGKHWSDPIYYLDLWFVCYLKAAYKFCNILSGNLSKKSHFLRHFLKLRGKAYA